MKDPKKEKHILRKKAVLLQMNDDKFSRQVENTEQSKKRSLYIPTLKKALSTGSFIKSKQPVRWTAILLRVKSGWLR